jgi:hypothetical protein
MLARIERAPLLRGAAGLWIVSDQVTAADAVVVLGGRAGSPTFRGGRSISQRSRQQVLVSQVADDRSVAIGAALGQTESNRQVLLRLGVPAGAIETFGTANKNTQDEARLRFGNGPSATAPQPSSFPAKSSRPGACVSYSIASLPSGRSVSKCRHSSPRNIHGRNGGRAGRAIMGSSCFKTRYWNASITG